MYNSNDIQFAGKHDFDKENSLSDGTWNKTFSVGIFKWELKSNGKSLKKGKALVRVSGDKNNSFKVFETAEQIVMQLDSNTYSGRKTVTVK